MKKVTIDWQRAAVLFDTLVMAVKKKSFPFDRVQVPQVRENIPASIEWGSYEHALFLFAVCYYMRGGIKSETAIKSLGKMYVASPDLFLHGSEYSAELIQNQLKQNRLNYASTQVAQFWVVNAQKLNLYWSNDPRRLFTDDPDYKTLCMRIIRKRNSDPSFGFFGFREKMVSMLIYFYMHAGIIPEGHFPLPIDFHLQRLMLSHGVLKVEGQGLGDDHYSADLLAAGREVTHQYCRDQNMRSIDLADALWLLSSTQCNQHPANRSVGGRKRNGRSTKLKPFEFVWNERFVDMYSRTCCICPVQSTCLAHIPAAHYYIQGKLVMRDEHQKPNQLMWRF